MMETPRNFNECLERISAVMAPLNSDGTSAMWSKMWNIRQAAMVLRDAMSDPFLADCPAAIELAFQSAVKLTQYAESLVTKQTEPGA